MTLMKTLRCEVTAFDRPFNLLGFLKEAFMPLMRKLLPANRLRPGTKSADEMHISTHKRRKNIVAGIVE
jgi:hypothetical protein